MARNSNRLTDKTVKALTKQGRHADGGGLYLQIGAGGGRAWLFMWVTEGKRSAKGLGSYPQVSLADAREKAAECRKQVAVGINPAEQARKQAAIPTFAEAVDRFLSEQRLSVWRNAKHKAQWKMTLGEAYCAAVVDMPVDQITVHDVLKVLQPVWTTKAETASRLRGRIERVLAFAETHGWRPAGARNPAQWKNGLDTVLPPRRKLTRGHHRAMAYSGVPAFMHRLAASTGVAARAIQFLILTAARSSEVTGARWNEVDFDAKVWTVPAERMKAGRPHSVPLSDAAVAILTLMAADQRSEFVFQSNHRAAGGVSEGALTKATRTAGSSDTLHGFRSSFRDWCGDQTSFPREVAEAALAHTVGNMTERAYRRGDALEKRRQLMAAWADYVTGTANNSKVVPIRA